MSLYKFTINYNDGRLYSGLVDADSYNEAVFHLETNALDKIKSIYIELVAEGEVNTKSFSELYTSTEIFAMGTEYYYNLSEKERLAYKTALRMYAYGNQSKEEIGDFMKAMYNIPANKFEEMYKKIKEQTAV